MGIEGQRRRRQPKTPAGLEEPGDDCGVAEMDAVKVADGHRAGSAARLPAGAGGKQTRGGKVRQGREECRGNEDWQTTWPRGDEARQSVAYARLSRGEGPPWRRYHGVWTMHPSP